MREMRSQITILTGRALRFDVAGVGLLLLGTTEYAGVDAQMSATEARIDAPAPGA
jgi:hypothetical protein